MFQGGIAFADGIVSLFVIISLDGIVLLDGVGSPLVVVSSRETVFAEVGYVLVV